MVHSGIEVISSHLITFPHIEEKKNFQPENHSARRFKIKYKKLYEFGNT